MRAGGRVRGGAAAGGAEGVVEGAGVEELHEERDGAAAGAAAQVERRRHVRVVRRVRRPQLVGQERPLRAILET